MLKGPAHDTVGEDTDMRYIDIKDQVVLTTNNLEYLSVDIMQAVLDNYLGYWEWMNLWEVRRRQHLSIKWLVHAHMQGYEHSCTVCTVVVDDTPAFFYVETYSRDSGQLEGDDRLYILSTTACKAFTTYIVNIAVQVALDTIEPEHGEVEVAEDIPALSTFPGGEILYGREYWYILDRWISSDNKEDSNA